MLAHFLQNTQEEFGNLVQTIWALSLSTLDLRAQSLFLFFSQSWYSEFP